MKSDSDILESIRTGKNNQVLNYLYDTSLRKVRHYIMKHGGNMEEVSDIFQDAVIVLFNQVRKNRFDDQHPVDAFLFTVAKNLWLNKIRKDKRVSNYGDMSSLQHTSGDTDHLDDLITKERSTAVARLFDQLNDKCKELLHYYNHEGLSMKEISIKLGYRNEQVTKATHYRCKQFLIDLVKGNQELKNLLRN